IFIIIIGAATFIENTYDTPTAQLLIYHATWFEFLMLVLVVLYIFNMGKKNLFQKSKLPQLIFHFSFVVLFIGGGVTRYFGFEANMHIVENESVQVLYTLEPYFQLRTADATIEYASKDALYFSQIENNSFHLEFETAENGNIEIDYRDYIFNAKDVFEEKGDEEDKKEYQTRNADKEGPDGLIITITYKGKTHDAVLFYDDTKYIQKFKPFNFDGLQLELTYGPKPIDLPFALKLTKFTLSKYPGTTIPSASESEVVLIDDRVNLKATHLIAKNKVLDYDGYRFFQTSYDDDEKGTILSVNYDYYGTCITYFGYILMILGAILILFSKRSHFSQLDAKIKEVRARRKSLYLSIILAVGIQSFSFSQNSIQNPINVDHADQFGHLLVQTYDGRFSSVHSLATDVIHKISGKDHFNIEGKGKMDPMQLFLDMHVDPKFWQHQNLIIVREQALRDIIGVNLKHAPYSVFFNSEGSYRLEELAKKAFQKKASEQSALDREIIKVNERVTIVASVLNGTYLKLFPDQTADNNKWISWNDPLAFKPLYGKILMLNADLKLDEFTYSNIMRSYFISTLYARETNDYKIPDKLMGYIGDIQRQLSPPEMLPSKTKI
ncbi:MAG: cytochrome c biogenesis protein ResB, partial [Bacteroidales bacterium]|nr:cytochrome c biogenesis protein ResB [Bacteroidales bacterium]